MFASSVCLATYSCPVGLGVSCPPDKPILNAKINKKYLDRGSWMAIGELIPEELRQAGESVLSRSSDQPMADILVIG